LGPQDRPGRRLLTRKIAVMRSTILATHRYQPSRVRRRCQARLTSVAI
jgi:hypothetical protein